MAAAAVVPAALAGWLLWQALDAGGDDGEDGRGAAAPSVSAPASPSGEPSPEGEESSPAKPPEKPSASTEPSRKPASGPLAGKTVVVDPGHNPGNRNHTAEINRQVDVGTHRKECDTTGTSTNDGYAEAEFTLDVAHRLRDLLEERGATVKLTQDGDRPFGPCVDERARIGNEAKADAVVSVHADGSTAAGHRGFHVILPAAVHGGGADTRPIVADSRRLGERIAGKLVQRTGSAPSNYIGGGTGLDVRDDLGGLNLSTVPKVFVECGNMRDAQDAALLKDADWRQKAALGMADGITLHLRG
ncbi:N-acetylmuramoyl-L-alanine amidase [Streptomyces sp. SCA2-2]|uniref:N-acetylmuramoyl-L-alanine amidase n=1 Tax=Streptomyces sp. SCA2-2 TaxID=1563677 RepID=UPI00101F95DD|nr:N-acetylmuramoyl-L-alanine amidase [Streptomyces sp. SCA2-2]RZE94500.1 N-acetylmuramoyl-L-alanine amidase [Streptomyces sp. SCA2-2]